MSDILKLKRDLIWVKSGPLIAGSVILLQGDDPNCQVPVPVPLLVASSHLVRNILAVDHLPPSFSTPVISFPSVSVDILENFAEMLISGMASVDITRLFRVREVFKMLGIIEDWIVRKTGCMDTNEDVINGKTDLDVLEKIKYEKCAENVQAGDDICAILAVSDKFIKIEAEEEVQIDNEIAKIEILVKFEEESKCALLNNQTGQSSHIYIDQEKSIDQELSGKNLSKHIEKVHNKENAQCPFCDKTLASSSLRGHIRNVHMLNKQSCPKCEKKISSKNLTKHIRMVHNKENVQCPHCYKTLAHTSLNAHIRSVHMKLKRKCPHCEKMSRYLAHHIRLVHNKVTA